MRFMRSIFLVAAAFVAMPAMAQFDSLVVNPIPNAFFPWCTGDRPSTISIRYRAAAGVTFADTNRFMVEFSDINGNFDTRFGGRFVGTVQKSASADTIKGIRIPDNMPWNPGFDATIPGFASTNVAIRVRATAPAFVSAPITGFSAIQLCRPRVPDLYSSALRPLKRAYTPGEQVSMTVYRGPELIISPGDQLRVVLSDSNGIFRGAGVVTTIIDSIAPTFVGDSLQVTFRLPLGLRPALRYRIRPTLTSLPNTASSTSTGHDVPVLAQVVSVLARNYGAVRVYPQPAQGTIRWQLPAGAGAVREASLLNLQGQRIGLASTGNQADVSQVAAGTYVLELVTPQRVFVHRVVVQ